MNNKFIKRAASVVLGVAVLSTCAFAANDITGAGYSEETISFSYSSTADKVSYIAYAATQDAEGTTNVGGENYTLGNIVAVNQIDDNTGAGSVSVAIDPTKLGSATHLIIMSGDSAGGYGSASVQVAIPVEDFDYTTNTEITAKEIKLGGTTYTDTPVVKLTITPNKSGTLSVTGLSHTYNEQTEAFSSVQNLPTNVTVTADSGYVIDNIYVIGAPQEAIDGGFTVNATVDFSEAE